MNPYALISYSRLYRLTLGLIVSLALPGCSDNSHEPPQESAPVPHASIEGPIEGEPTIISTFITLPDVGYRQDEYFVSGDARSFRQAGELGPDGNWQVEAAEQADYLTRIVVYRPIDPVNFNGTVVVEWLNVSAGYDTAPDWLITHTELLREGYAWVGVSAQKVGVDALIAGRNPLGIDSSDRYSALHHPGDSFSYDIYSQIGQSITDPAGVAPLGDLLVERLMAAGESQSAGRMMTYVNALAPVHGIYDAYFVHSRTSGSSALSQAPQPDIPTPEVVRVREDLDTPVLMLQTESDLFALGAYPDRQPDSANFRLWEVAGTAHADLYTFLDGRTDLGTDPAIAAVKEVAAPIQDYIECDRPVNAGPQHFVANAAIAALNRWLTDGTAAPEAPRLAVAGDPAAFVLDVVGNVEGGVRTPYVDAPVAILSGEENTGAGFCFLAGTTKLFDALTLGQRYSADNAVYREAVNKSTDDAVMNGFLLPADAALIKAYAAQTDLFAP